MNNSAQEQIKAGFYRIFNRQYFGDPNNKNRLCELNAAEKSNFYHEQSVFVEREFSHFKSTLETMIKQCGQDTADKVCRIVIASSLSKMRDEETIRHKAWYITLCEKYGLRHIADKLRKIK